MEVGDELMTWLKDKKKEYTVRLEFAIKAWQSVDFVYINKYEVICKWLAATLAKEKTNNGELPVEQLQQLFALRAQPGLVSVETKSQLIKAILKRINNDKNADKKSYAQLLQSLLNFELLQDALRADYELLMRSYGTMFKSYEKQLENPTVQRHAEFIVPILQQLQDYVQRAQHLYRLLDAYTQEALQPLCELLLQLRTHGLCCFEQLAALELQFNRDLELDKVKERLSKQVLHVRMLLLESALYNERLNVEHLQDLVSFALDKEKLVNPDEPPLALAIHALESLRKHNITMALEKNETVVMSLFTLTSDFKEQHLEQVLMLLCAALRLNPLLLEPNVYQITIWMLTKSKTTERQLCLYGDYLVQMLNMSRRLSRIERFVMQLLKALRQWLSKYKLKLDMGEKRQRLEPEPPAYSNYLEMLLQPHQSVSSLSTDRLAQTWPSQTAGAAFTRLCSQLMAKPSMVIWKMLLHTFSELLEEKSSAVLPENLNFAIELQVALLNQYLMGTRLVEQLQLHQPEVEQLRRHTAQILQQFGQHLLAREHNRSTMNAFLECVDRATGFEQLLSYYWPDGLSRQSLEAEQQLPYKFLSENEWDLIRQRVHNFGKTMCRQRLQRLELQLVQTNWLLSTNESCPDTVVELVPPKLLQHLNRSQKERRLQQQPMKRQLELLEDVECVEVLAMQLLHGYAEQKIKGTLLPKQLKHTSTDLAAMSLVLRQHSASSSKQPKLPVTETEQLIAALQQLPLAQLMSSIKLRVWLLLLTLYLDLKRGQLVELANQLLEQLIDLLHFGQPLSICSHFPELSELLQLVPLDDSDGSVSWRFYEMLFGRCIRRLTPGSDIFLASCAEYFREQLQQEPRTLDMSECRLLLLAIETLSGATGAQARRMQRHLQPLLEVYGQYVGLKFKSAKKTPADAAEFVQRTLSGYAVYLSSCINRAAKAQREEEQQQQQEGKKEENENQRGKQQKRKLEAVEEKEEPEQHKRQKKKKRKEQEETEQNEDKEEEAKKEEKENDEPCADKNSTIATPIDENLRRICKIYIGHSLNYRNVHAIKLLNVALTHREQLHLDQDEIEFLLYSYWRQLNADIDSSTLDIQGIEPAIKLIIGYKTNEDFLLLLRRLATQLEGMQRPKTEVQHTSLQNVLILLQLFSKCSLSSIKGAMFNEHFELLMGNMSLRLPDVTDTTYCKHMLRLLEAQGALASNRTVPLTGETLDAILGTMLDMNIKRFISAGGKLEDFVVLHGKISENLLLLLRQHGVLMSDRASQLTALCQDLIESIVCYRSDRKQAQSLNEEELDALAELALKFVTLLAGISAGPQALAVKRVAPFLLIFTINQMVTSERPTTLFDKIKVHLDRVCHELISLCDHRAGHFILRSSNEAGSRLYQNLVKEHDKYHKFRGKV